MRRWFITAVIVLTVTLAAGMLLPYASLHPAPECATRMASMGLILLEDDAGLYVLGVRDGSRAGSAGIQPGDRLTASRSTKLTTISQFEDLLAAQQDAASTLPVTLARQNQTVIVCLSLR